MTRGEPPPAVAWLPLLRDGLAAEGRYRLPLRGDSMTPTLPPACEIEVVPLGETPRVGELIVFALGDALVAHRLVRRAGNRWIAQGDNRRASDPPLKREQILGRVSAAYAGTQRVWPGRAQRAWARWWVARAWGWRLARRVWTAMFGTRRR